MNSNNSTQERTLKHSTASRVSQNIIHPSRYPYLLLKHQLSILRLQNHFSLVLWKFVFTKSNMLKHLYGCCWREAYLWNACEHKQEGEIQQTRMDCEKWENNVINWKYWCNLIAFESYPLRTYQDFRLALFPSWTCLPHRKLYSLSENYSTRDTDGITFK